MSVRLGLLAMLAEQPRYGSALRAEFEARTGGAWPLNIGQVSTTLARLERDGLVEAAEPARTSGDLLHWQVTPAGREAVQAWWREPVERGAPARDEVAIKLALAVTVPGVDVAALVQTQRTATLRAMQDYTRLKSQTDLDSRGGAAAGRADLAWSLVLDNLIFAAEAEVRWLDHCEARVARAARLAPLPSAAPDPQPIATAPARSRPTPEEAVS